MADPRDDGGRGEADARAGGGAGGDPLLDRDRIDDLLGDGAGDAEDASFATAAGIEALVNTAAVTYERLPMLEVVFDRFVRILTTSMRNFTSENVEVHLEGVESLRFGDYLGAVPEPAMVAVFRAIEWDNHGLATVDGPLTYAMVDVLLGGHRGATPIRVEGRPYSTIERTLAERLIRLVLADLGGAFEPLSAVRFEFERLETNPRFAAVARPGNAAVLCRLRVDIDDRGGTVEVLIPYATLEPVRDVLLQMFMGEKFGRDSIWEGHLARKMWVTDLGLEAVLDEQTLPLGQVMDLAVGSTLPLNARPDSPVHLRCAGVPLLVGRVGRIGDALAVRIEDEAPPRGGGQP